MTRISYQLYCSRNFPPLEDTLRMLAKAGYQEVEGYGALFADAVGLRGMLDAHVLRMTSSHISMDMIAGDPDGTIALAEDLGIKKIFAPFLAPDDRPGDSAGWRAFGQRLAEAAKPLQAAGLVVGWHNHAFEFDATPQGDVPLDLIVAADDSLMLELDLGWVRVAGHDPVAWIEKYAGRITTVHIKDIAPDGQAADEDGWADVGHGIMDWSAIHTALQATGVTHYVAEHDNPSDHERFATRSMAAMHSF
ncbi:sugar phosphate isomerase/epimerase family protein [Yoonia sp. 2307UL14-13]|uniref:sugar phosphate isomerase/epimerase family protein n=1 Tax=Yoonia sp. 2307UL14-13 TaxID=3126506 RepID=UPI00309777F8